ncbi:hypothetical protein Angca_007957, partial [Angiostrongylus cantonensis]
TDEDIINNIDASYFIEDDFDATAYELKSQFCFQKLFGIDLHIEDVDCERVRLRSQLQVVSKKISTLIMEQPSYNAQIEDMDSINVSIRELVHSIRTIREALGIAQSESRRALYILANEKKKRLLNRLHSTLRIIKTLYETEFHLRDCIESGNFPVAIRLCLEAKEAANTYHHFSCVSDLMTKLVGSTNLIEGALDEALSTFTMVFDQDQYVLVYSALTMLNKVELASRKLVNHFVTTLRKSSRKIVEEHCIADHCLVNVAEMSYEALCEVCLLSAIYCRAVNFCENSLKSLYFCLANTSCCFISLFMQKLPFRRISLSSGHGKVKLTAIYPPKHLHNQRDRTK